MAGTRSSRIRALLAPGFVAALLLTACGADGLTDIGEPNLTDTASLPELADTSAPNEPGPLEEFLARITGWTGEAQTRAEAVADFERDLREEQEEIAACMAELGFDYVPTFAGRGTLILGEFSDDDATLDRASREFAGRYGFGISTTPPQRGVDLDFTTALDPNAALQAQMSPAELAAWWQALHGFAPGGTANWDADEPQGCIAQVLSDRQARSSPAPEFLGLQDEVDQFLAAVWDDPRVAELESRWAICLADTGVGSFTDRFELLEELWREWDALHGLLFDDDGTAAAAVNRTPDAEALQAFTDREIATALADWDCLAEIGFEAELRAIELDLQRQFVDQHLNELEAWAQFEEARRAG
ncbi:MAG: hypothetical protein FWG25_05990 [Promicromonosporaceae bacterium]|nr:hypothetical protein [Promicromonosporaceae bacterium]